MKHTLFQTIIKESIREGGNTGPSAQPIRGDLVSEITKDVTDEVSSTFNQEDEPTYSTSLSERLETLKLNLSDVRRIAKSLIRENVSNELNAFHGTTANFDKFDPNFIGKGQGAQFYGSGVYVTTSRETGEGYARLVSDNNGAPDKYVYTVDIPDDNGNNYLNIIGNTPELYDKIANGFKKLRPDIADSIDYCFQYCKENDTLMWLFQSSCEYELNLKEISEMLMSLGFDGIKVPVTFSGPGGDAGIGREGYNYTIFDANKVKIIRKDRLQ